MKLLVLADLHDNRAALDCILAEAGPCDALLLAGDITNFGTVGDAERIVRTARFACPRVWAVAGNCDSAAIDRRLDELGVGLHGRGALCGAVGVQGLSAMPPWRGMYSFSEEELARFLRDGAATIAAARQRIVLAHCPPLAEGVDRTLSGKNVGSTALRAYVDTTQPAAVFCGHIHEGRGLETLGATQVVNCGPAAAGYYAVAETDGALRVQLRRAGG